MPSLIETALANAACAAVLALFALAVGRVWRRPALLHGLWLLVLLKLITPPLLPLPVRVLPAPPPPAAPAVAAAPAVEEPATVGQFLFLPSPNEDELIVGVKIESVRDPSTSAAPPATAPVTTSTSAVNWRAVGFFLTAIWASGAAVWFVTAAARLARFQRLLRFARPAPAAIRDRAAELARQMGLRRCPDVAIIPGLLPPMVWMAVGRPRIYLPGELLNSLDATECDTVLAHELAHLRRRDHWVRWLEILVQGAFWWYPLVPLIRRQIRAYEEESCDALVVAVLPARTYAAAIVRTLDFLAGDRAALPAAASGLGRVASLKRRLSRIMTGGAAGRLGAGGRAVLVAAAFGLLPLIPTLAQSNPRSAFPGDENRQLAGPVEQDSDDSADDVVVEDFAPAGAPAPRALAYSPDGRRLALAMDDHTVEIRDRDTGRPLQILRGHTGPVNCLAYSPDGKTLATGSSDRTVKLWDAAGSLKATLKGHLNWVFALAFAPDGRTLASGGYDRIVRIWNVGTGKQVAVLKGHDAAVRAVAFAPNGATVASASSDRSVRLWDVASRQVRALLTGHDDAVRAVAFSGDGQTVASASDDGTARLWDARTGLLRATLTGHTGEVTSLAIAPWGRVLVTGGMDRTTRLWNAVYGTPIAKLPGHRDGVIAVAFVPDTGALTSLGLDRQIRQSPLARVSVRVARSERLPASAVYVNKSIVYRGHAAGGGPAPGGIGPTAVETIEPPAIVIVDVLREP